MNSYRVPLTCCPACGVQHDMASNLTGRAGPEPDGFTMCTNCGVPLRYNADMSKRIATPDDLSLLEPEELQIIQASQKIIAELRIHETR